MAHTQQENPTVANPCLTVSCTRRLAHPSLSWMYSLSVASAGGEWVSEPEMRQGGCQLVFGWLVDF